MVKKKVLLVENSEDVSSIVRWVLEDKGYEVITTNHLPAAELADFKCDLIVLDEWLKSGGGHMLCKEIKAIHNLKHIPVVIFSTAVDIKELMDDCGADGFVRKPFDIDELTSEVERLLS